ncbi:MAG: hypothetical protein SWJ54_11330 [Cyanobacteriota bacterium]|nr:hypothetical protein [Cyanobacteriota bacterium]
MSRIADTYRKLNQPEKAAVLLKKAIRGKVNYFQATIDFSGIGEGQKQITLSSCTRRAIAKSETTFNLDDFEHFLTSIRK